MHHEKNQQNNKSNPIERHIKIILIRRFLSFVEKMKNSGKPPLVMLLSEAASDVRSTTGSNLRNIMLLAGKTSIDAVSVSDADRIEYFKLKDEEAWKVQLATEIIEAKANIKVYRAIYLTCLNPCILYLVFEI